MNYEKPGGAMHEVIRRAFDELRLHSNPQGAITVVTHALANADGLSPLIGGRDYNAGSTPPSTPKAYGGRAGDLPGSSGAGGTNAYGNAQSSGDLGGGRSRSSTGGGGGPSTVGRGSAGTGATMQWITSGSVGVGVSGSAPAPSSMNVAPATANLPAGSAEWLHRRHFFNRTQLLRLLLIRCEAYSTLRQHARALQDAERAVEVSQGQSAEAYFNVGREQRRQFNIVESAIAFDTAEALLKSMQQAIAAGKNVVDGWSPQQQSDETFWADRGFQMEEVHDMGISRREYELQERSRFCRANISDSPSDGPTSPTGNNTNTNNKPGLRDAETPRSSSTKGQSRYVADPLSPHTGLGTATGSFAGSPYEAAATTGSQSGGSATNRSFINDNNYNGESGAGADDDSAGSGNYATSLIQCGMSQNELAMWRRLANESAALLAMRQTHTVPCTVLNSTMTLLDRRVAGTRGGLVISIENNTNSTLRFVGALAPDGLYHESYSFPDVIHKAHCGVAMLHPGGWGGYSGCVCYELHEYLCCFFYFDSPLLGSLKYGVRFVDLRANDLRRAFAEVYKETGVYGIAGGTTTAAIMPPIAPVNAATGGNGQINGSCYPGVAGTPGRGDAARSGSVSGGVSIRGASTPLTTTVASMNAARAAIRMPPSNTWMTAHAASAASQRPVKASTKLIGGQTIALSLGEVLAVRLRSVELLPALEYVGAVALKKLSAVSKRYRELINNLPPPMFYGPGRRAYPDYCVGSDRFVSPWIVRDLEPVHWKLVFDGRMGDQEEFSMSDESDLQKHILCFSADAQTKVTGYVYQGDKRCLQYIIKESWIPFSNTLYITTPVGRTFANCVAMNNQTQYTLSLTSAMGSSGGGGAGGDGSIRGGDETLYTARKRVQPAAAAGAAAATGNEAARATTVAASPVVTGSVVTRDEVQVKGIASAQPSNSAAGLTGANHSSSNTATGSVTGVVRNGTAHKTSSSSMGSGHNSTKRNASSGYGVMTMPMVGGGMAQMSTLACPSSSSNVSATSRTGSVANGTHYRHSPPSSATPSRAGTMPLATGGAGGSNSANTAVNVGNAASSATPSQPPESFTIWRSQRVSGGAVAGGGAPSTTNGGADIVAEVKVNPMMFGMVAKGYCTAEVTLLPGADALLVSLLSFLMTRW